MASRRGVLAGTAAALGSGLSGCLVRGLGAPPIDLGGLAGRTGTTAPDGGGTATTHTFGWTHDGTDHDCAVVVPDGLLAYGRARPRVRDRGAYVADPYHDDFLDAVAGRLAARAGAGADPLGIARTFVQQLPYETDRASTGRASYARYPAETVAAGRADCEDAAILLSGLLERLGHDTVLLAFWEAEHMGLGLATDDASEGTYAHEGSHYTYLETAVPGWRVGEVPDVVGAERPEVMPVRDLPTLVTRWSTERVGRGLRAHVAVRNVGEAATEDVWVELSLETSGGAVVGTGRSDARSIAAGDVSEVPVVARPSSDGVELARIAVLDGEEVVDEALVRSADAAPST